MDGQAIGTTELRIIIGVVGVVIFALIYFFGRPRRPGQGRRKLFQRDGGDREDDHQPQQQRLAFHARGE